MSYKGEGRIELDYLDVPVVVTDGSTQMLLQLGNKTPTSTCGNFMLGKDDQFHCNASVIGGCCLILDRQGEWAGGFCSKLNLGIWE